MTMQQQDSPQFSIGQQIYFPGNRRTPEAYCTIVEIDERYLRLVHATKGRSKVRKTVYGKVFFTSRADWLLGSVSKLQMRKEE